MKQSVKDALLKQRLLLDKLSKKLNMAFLPVVNKKTIAGYLTCKGKVIPIEAKVRRCNYGAFDSTLLEQKKVNKLVSTFNRNQLTTVWYVEFFEDNKAIIYDLPNLPMEWCTESCNAVTLETGKVSKKDKTVTFVNYRLGTLVDLTDTPQTFTIRTETYDINEKEVKVTVHPIF